MCCWVRADFVRAAGSGSSFRGKYRINEPRSEEIPLLRDLVREVGQERAEVSDHYIG